MIFKGHVYFLICVIFLLLCIVCNIITLPICHAQVVGTILMSLSLSICLTFLTLKETKIVLDTVL